MKEQELYSQIDVIDKLLMSKSKNTIKKQEQLIKFTYYDEILAFKPVTIHNLKMDKVYTILESNTDITILNKLYKDLSSQIDNYWLNFIDIQSELKTQLQNAQHIQFQHDMFDLLGHKINKILDQKIQNSTQSSIINSSLYKVKLEINALENEIRENDLKIKNIISFQSPHQYQEYLLDNLENLLQKQNGNKPKK